MAKVYLLLGSNLGNRLDFLKAAKSSIETNLGLVFNSSSIFESDAWGFESANKFLNQVLFLSTSKPPEFVLKKIKEIELQLGRERRSNTYESRTIDIDILFYNDLIVEKDDLIIPHPRMQDRRFTLLPLNEIAGKFIHPKLGKSVKELLDECKDEVDVKKFEE